MKLTYNFKQSDEPFDSSMLKIGEMMELDVENSLENKRLIIIKTFNGFVSLNNPKITWSGWPKLKGRKLLPGESVTLIQE